MSFSSGAMAVMPAITSPVPAVEQEVATVVAPHQVRSEDYQPITDAKNVERFLSDYFADIPIMARIAKCESRNRHFNSRGEVLRGEVTPLDRGVMQINLHYHEKSAAKLGLNVHNIDDNVAYARHLYKEQGVKPWKSSAACWSKSVGSELAKN